MQAVQRVLEDADITDDRRESSHIQDAISLLHVDELQMSTCERTRGEN